MDAMATVDQPASPSAGAARPTAAQGPSGSEKPEGGSREEKKDEDENDDEPQDWQNPAQWEDEVNTVKDNVDWWRCRQDWSWHGPDSRKVTDARGYLPKVPGYDGDRKKNSKGYQNYKRKVESFVAIAKSVIPEEQIGVRL